MFVLDYYFGARKRTSYLIFGSSLIFEGRFNINKKYVWRKKRVLLESTSTPISYYLIKYSQRTRIKSSIHINAQRKSQSTIKYLFFSYFLYVSNKDMTKRFSAQQHLFVSFFKHLEISLSISKYLILFIKPKAFHLISLILF